MKKLKELLSESYAWDKKPGKPLPTLSEVQAEYERKIAKQRVSESHNDLGVTEPYHVEISVRDAKRAMDMITNVPMLRGALNRGIITTYGSNVYATENQTMFRMLMDVLEHAKIELSSSSANVDDPEYVWKEEAKPDFIDLDKDGDTEEPMRDAAKEMNEAGKFYRGSIHNDEPFDFRDDKPMRPKLSTPAEWDKLMDRVNNDPRFETYTGVDGYQIKDTKGNNLIWQLYPGKSGLVWKGIGRESAQFPHPRQFSDVAELIKNFYEVTGLVKENVNLGETMRRFGTKNI